MRARIAATFLLVTLGIGASSAWAQTYQVLAAFESLNGPRGTLVFDASGNLYGTDSYGGASQDGSIFKIAPDGTLTTLHSFTGSDGANPQAGLALDSAGNLYGTTSCGGDGTSLCPGGGVAGNGTVFKLAPDGTLTTLHRFTGSDGANPQAGLTFDSVGNLYGTTYCGGGGGGTSICPAGVAAGNGIVFKLAPDGRFTTLHRFTWGDGANPQAGVVFDNAGNLYGTTSCGGVGTAVCPGGGAAGDGTVFRLGPDGTFTTLHNFTYSQTSIETWSDGANPEAGVVLDNAGNLYGTTRNGGASGFGTIFQLAPDGVFTIFHNFTAEGEGSYPDGGVVFDGAGNLYGTTTGGSLPGFGSVCGTVFQLAPNPAFPTDGTLTTLHSFCTGGSGDNPEGSLTLDNVGNLYGTTSLGGVSDHGTVFRLAPDGTLATLSDPHGTQPVAGVAFDGVGNLYGTTSLGGVSDHGTVFRLAPSGTLTTLHAFAGSDGANPVGTLVFDGAGNLYGATTGGDSNNGTVFRLAPDGTLTTLHEFAGSDGAGPQAGVVFDNAGNLYGTTSAGGASGFGTLFQLAPNGTLTTLYSFTGGSDGARPAAGLVLDSAGNLYGTTSCGGGLSYNAVCPFGAIAFGYGTVFKLAPDGTFTTLHAFTGSDGANPQAGLILDPAGNLRGTTSCGGSGWSPEDGCPGGAVLAGGTIFQLSTDGTLTTLHSFSWGRDGGLPNAALIFDGVGNLYGTTSRGGVAGGAGTVFQLAPDGTLTTLHSFIPSSGDYPEVGLVFDNAGNLYGTTSADGPEGGKGGGVVFRLRLNIPRFAFTDTNYVANETSGTAVITVKRTGPTTQPASVNYATSEGTAVAGVEYQATSGTLSFGPGVVSKSFTVPLVNDTLPHPNTTVLLSLNSPTAGTVVAGPDTAVLTIVNTDSSGQLSFSAPAYSVSEDASSMRVSVKRTGGNASGVTVDYAASGGTAVSGINYTPVSGTLSFGAGVLSQSFTIPIQNDFSVEANPTVDLLLGNVGGGASLGLSTAVLTIMKDNPSLQFSASNYSVSVSGGKATIFVERLGSRAAPLSVSYATSDGTATAPADYAATSGTLTFGPGIALQSFTVPVVNVVTQDGNLTVLLSLRYPTGGAALGQRSTAVLSIKDRLVAGVLQFRQANFTAGEKAGSALVSVTRYGGTAGGVTVDYATSDGSAQAPGDYTATSGTLTFGLGAAKQTFAIPIVDNHAVEGDQTVNLTLTNATGGAALGSQSTSIVTILSDDPLLQFSAASYSVSETGKAATIAVKRSGPGSSAVTVNFATSDGSATAPGDYTANSGTLTFGPGVMEATFPVAVTNEALVKGDETVELTLSGPTGGAALGPQATAVLTILTDDPSFEFGASTYHVTGASNSALITVKRLGNPKTAASVAFATSDGTATAGAEYLAMSGTLTFAPGVLKRTFAVPVLADTDDVGNVTINLTLSNPQNSLLGTTSTAVLTIGDVDVAGTVQFSVSDYSVSDTGQVATITVTRTGGRASNVTVNYETSDESATAGRDYAAASGTLTFGYGQASQIFTVEVLDPGAGGLSKSVELTLTNPGGGSALGTLSTARLWIVGNQ